MTRTMPLSLTVIAATSWAAATILTKVALRGLAPLDLLGIELFSSAIAMASLLVARGRPLLPRNWPAFALLGVLEPGLSFGLFDFGLSRTGAADGAILIASQSLFGVLLARVLLRERVSPLTRAAVAVGFAGSALVGLAETGHGASLGGDLLVIAASAAAASSGVGVRRLSADADTLAATTTQLIAAALFAAPVILIADTGGRTQLASVDFAHLVAAVATGLLGGAVPFLAFNRAIRDLTVAHAGLILKPDPGPGRRRRRRGPRRTAPLAEIVGGLLVVAAATASATLDERSVGGHRRNRRLSRCASSVLG